MVTAFVIAKCTPMPLTLRHSELDSESQINITQIDAESTFVTSACECGVAVRHDRFRKVLDIKPTPDGGTWKSILGSTTSKICLKNPVGCLQQPRAAVIGLSLPSVAPCKWIFSPTTPRTRYRCVLPVAPKTDFRLFCIKNLETKIDLPKI